MSRVRVVCDDKNSRVCVVTIAREPKANALDRETMGELRAACDASSSATCVVLRGAGASFCAGIDIGELERIIKSGERESKSCEGRRRAEVLRVVEEMQTAFSAFERTESVTIAAVRGACFGAGVDLITACDIRLCSPDAKFCVKEVDLGICADVGTTQRLPSVVGHARAMELCLTARVVSASEALSMGLVSEVCDDVDARALALAREIAKKSPLAIRGTKRVLLRQRDHPNVRDGLHYVAMNSAAMLLSDDLYESLRARAEKREPIYAKL